MSFCVCVSFSVCVLVCVCLCLSVCLSDCVCKNIFRVTIRPTLFCITQSSPTLTTPTLILTICSNTPSTLILIAPILITSPCSVDFSGPRPERGGSVFRGGRPITRRIRGVPWREGAEGMYQLGGSGAGPKGEEKHYGVPESTSHVETAEWEGGED